MHVYRETHTAAGVTLFGSCHDTSAAPGPLHGTPILAPYSPLLPLQQRRLAARRHATTYCYDFPAVFNNALRALWDAHRADQPSAVPRSWSGGHLLEAVELVLTNAPDYRAPSAKLSLVRCLQCCCGAQHKSPVTTDMHVLRADQNSCAVCVF